TARIHISLLEYSISRIADGLPSRGGHIARRMLAPINITDRHVVVSRPSVIHTDRQAEKVSRLHRRMRRVDADGSQNLFIPIARNALGRRRRWHTENADE